MQNQYRGVKFHQHTDISMIEFKISENNIYDEFDYIEKISNFVELIGHKKPKYILFTKNDKDFEISPDLYEYTQNHVIQLIFEYQVDKIFFLVTPERYEKYKNKMPKNIFIFQKMEEIRIFVDK